jgi:hypothetical protein
MVRVQSVVGVDRVEPVFKVRAFREQTPLIGPPFNTSPESRLLGEVQYPRAQNFLLQRPAPAT